MGNYGKMSIKNKFAPCDYQSPQWVLNKDEFFPLKFRFKNVQNIVIAALTLTFFIHFQYPMFCRHFNGLYQQIKVVRKRRKKLIHKTRPSPGVF